MSTSNHLEWASTRTRNMCPMYGPAKSRCNRFHGAMGLMKVLVDFLGRYYMILQYLQYLHPFWATRCNFCSNEYVYVLSMLSSMPCICISFYCYNSLLFVLSTLIWVTVRKVITTLSKCFHFATLWMSIA